jgi:hypothetical protein
MGIFSIWEFPDSFLTREDIMGRFLNTMVSCERIAFQQVTKLHQRYTDVLKKENDAFGMMYLVKRNRNKLGAQMMMLDNENCQSALEDYSNLCDEGDRVLAVLNNDYSETSGDTSVYNDYLLDAMKTHQPVNVRKYVVGKTELEQGLSRIKHEIDMVTLERERARKKFEIGRDAKFVMAQKSFNNSDAELKALEKTHKALRLKKNVLAIELGACRKMQKILSSLVMKKIWEEGMSSRYLKESSDDRNRMVPYDKVIF